MARPNFYDEHDSSETSGIHNSQRLNTHSYQNYYHNEDYTNEQSQYDQTQDISGRSDHVRRKNGPTVETRYLDDIPLQQTQPPQDHTKRTRHPRSPESLKPELNLTTGMPKRTRGGFFSGKIPWFVYLMSLIQLTVFVVEIVKNSIVTGSPIMIHPTFNPMIGPSTYVLINMGARFVPCMRTTFYPNTNTAYPQSPWPCPNTTTLDASSPSNQCTLSQLCGFSPIQNAEPNQWFRFITPIFLHAGIIHIGFNLLLQLTMGRDMEKAIGNFRFAVVYLSSGIFGFVLGGNFAPSGIASTGASGSLFGILAIVLLDLFYTWNERDHPLKELIWILFDVIISFVLGLLPGLDNFSHIGGFIMGLILGICILHSPNVLRRRMGDTPTHKRDGSRYSAVASESTFHLTSSNPQPNINDNGGPTKGPAAATTAIATPADLSSFTSKPIGFFKNRRPLWWAWWLVRALSLIGGIVGFILLLNNFYLNRNTCTWCKYLSCLDITVSGTNWCDLGYLSFPQNGTTT